MPKTSLREYMAQLGLTWGSEENHGPLPDRLTSPSNVNWASIDVLSERELEAVQAALIALRDHFPSLYRPIALQYPEVRNLLARASDGRTIKLRRMAIARIANSG